MKNALSEAVNQRMRIVRRWVQQAVVDAQPYVAVGPVQMRDAYAGVRFVGKCLFNSRDIQHVASVTDAEMYQLLVEGTAGAAEYRLTGRSKAHGGQR